MSFLKKPQNNNNLSNKKLQRHIIECNYFIFLTISF